MKRYDQTSFVASHISPTPAGTATLESAEISVKGLLINLDAWFDSENLLLVCEQTKIIANIAYNKRNSSKDSDSL